MVISLKKVNKLNKNFIDIYNKVFIISPKKLQKKVNYIIGYPIYYRKVYYFYIIGSTNKYINSFINPNKMIQLSTIISKNKINYFIPIKLPNLIID